MFKDGLIGPPITRWRESYVKQLKLAQGSLKLVGELVEGAIDLHLWGQTNLDTAARDPAYRGAAIHLRVALEELLGGYVLRIPEKDRRQMHLQGYFDKISGGRAGRSRIKPGHRRDLLNRAEYIRDLGDSAGHPLLKKPSREIPATEGNVSTGLERFQQLIGCVRLPGAGP